MAAKIERDFKLNENLVRYMVVNIDPKWEESMLAVAKDEHALALQIAVTDDSIDGMDDYSGPPRRRHEGKD